MQHVELVALFVATAYFALQYLDNSFSNLGTMGPWVKYLDSNTSLTLLMSFLSIN